MDLLTEKNYVPAADKKRTSILNILMSEMHNLKVNDTSDYGFMDLLQEKGMIPANDNIVKRFNFSQIRNKISALFVETSDNLVQYGFMDLLKEKGLVDSNVTPIDHSNDNEQEFITIAS